MFWGTVKVTRNEIEEAEKRAQIAYDLKMADLYKRCQVEMAEMEHTYHSHMEVKRTEMAKIDALLEARKEMLENAKVNYDLVVKEKDKTIMTLTEAIMNLSKNKEK